MSTFEGPFESGTRVTRPPRRPPTPGPVFNSVGALLDQARFSQDNGSFTSYRSSEDLTTPLKNQSQWIHLDEVP
jgi:hypothetical protein